MSSAEIAIIGGTGIYDPDIFSKRQEIKVHTPYGEPSDIITLAEFCGRRIAFIPRHGRGHRIPPHRINNQANIWALKELGVSRILAPSAVGSMRLDFRPGDIAIPDQFVDFTKGRHYTFYDGGKVCHVSTADPFCPELRSTAISTAKSLGFSHHEAAAYVCVEGPRFSTRAESKFFKDMLKADVIGMTLVPECVLAREAEICYVSLAMVTDYDVWSDIPVSSKEVIETLRTNAEITKKLIADMIPSITLTRTCNCAKALEGAML